MPKTLPQRIVFTIVMATIMVYGMIVYNVALNTGGVTNATFGMALHEMPIMVPVAFVFDTIGGVLVAKVYNLFAKQKINPMIGAAGISAFPMSARVVNKMGLQEDNQNFLLMHAVGVNVSGQIASVIAGGMILTLFA